MPVFWFALSFVEQINIVKTILAFVVLHLIVYPSSNGYNSYMDRDETSIGGIRDPLQPTKQLYIVTVIMDAIALLLSSFISLLFTVCILCYIVCSRLYSYRGIRLKRFPVIGYITVILNQGALTFFMVYHASNTDAAAHTPLAGLIAAAFLIGGFYPITQVYQHESDKKDGVNTISMLLGKRGTFVFCAALYAVALGILFSYYMHQNHLMWFAILQIFFVPVLVYFVWWFTKVVRNEATADFKHTMRMNWIASTCTSLAFITLIFFNQFG
jgi:1,4-dihydroxy-2-naphthoate polyprenyltransferase